VAETPKYREGYERDRKRDRKRQIEDRAARPRKRTPWLFWLLVAILGLTSAVVLCWAATTQI
jgi:hypothetical protein